MPSYSRVIFMGTPEFAVPPLLALHQSKYEIVAVVSRPDRPFGRDKVITPPPVASTAKELGLNLVQPEKLKSPEVVDALKALKPDYLVVAAYGKIIPDAVLTIPEIASINIHPSLIPKYRGAAPIQWTLINGDSETGVTLMDIIKELDAGDVYMQEKISVEPDDTTGSLSEKLSKLSAEMIVRCIDLFEEGKISPAPQDHKKAIMAPPLTHEDGLIDWSKPAMEIFNRFRGVTPKPGSYTHLGDKVIKIHGMAIDNTSLKSGSKTPGTVIDIKDDHFKVDTAAGIIKITELQLEGKKRMTSADFLRGHKIEVGTSFK